MTAHPRNRWRFRLVAAGATLAAGWVALLCVVQVNSPGAEPILLLNGFVLAGYGLCFGIAYPGHRAIATSLVAFFAGGTHPLWLLIGIAMLDWMFSSRGRFWAASSTGQQVAMLALTGLTFASIFGLTTGSWRTVIPALMGTIAAVTLAVFLNVAALPESLFIGCALLHIGIATGLAWSTLVAIRRHPPPELTCRCGYDLRGLTTLVCPECGQTREEPFTPSPLGLPRLDRV